MHHKPQQRSIKIQRHQQDSPSNLDFIRFILFRIYFFSIDCIFDNLYIYLGLQSLIFDSYLMWLLSNYDHFQIVFISYLQRSISLSFLTRDFNRLIRSNWEESQYQVQNLLVKRAGFGVIFLVSVLYVFFGFSALDSVSPEKEFNLFISSLFQMDFIFFLTKGLLKRIFFQLIRERFRDLVLNFNRFSFFYSPLKQISDGLTLFIIFSATFSLIVDRVFY